MDMKIKGNDTMVRDGRTGAISATEEEYLKYKQRKASYLKEQQREREFQSLKVEVEMLKDILNRMLEASQKPK